MVDAVSGGLRLCLSVLVHILHRNLVLTMGQVDTMQTTVQQTTVTTALLHSNSACAFARPLACSTVPACSPACPAMRSSGRSSAYLRRPSSVRQRAHASFIQTDQTAEGVIPQVINKARRDPVVCRGGRFTEGADHVTKVLQLLG